MTLKLFLIGGSGIIIIGLELVIFPSSFFFFKQATKTIIIIIIANTIIVAINIIFRLSLLFSFLFFSLKLDPSSSGIEHEGNSISSKSSLYLIFFLLKIIIPFLLIKN